jgi:hypothetical protein
LSENELQEGVSLFYFPNCESSAGSGTGWQLPVGFGHLEENVAAAGLKIDEKKLQELGHAAHGS